VLRETDDFLLLRGKGVESWWSVAFQRGATRRLATIVTTSTRDPQDARSWPIAQFPRSAPLSASRRAVSLNSLNRHSTHPVRATADRRSHFRERNQYDRNLLPAMSQFLLEIGST
jgi:hypothetical protein